VFSSSAAVYGDTPGLPKIETSSQKPLSPYAISKVVGEHYCRVFYEVYGLQTISLRYFNVFGPRQDPSSQYAAVIPNFIIKALKNEPLTIYGDGEQSRDSIFVADTVRANVLAAENEEAFGDVFNIGRGKSITINELAKIVLDLCGKSDLEIKHEEPRLGDIKHSWADISRAKNLLGFGCKYNLEESLGETIKYFETLL
jgi:nucleoside-diphosphate-sugar epimerase